MSVISCGNGKNGQLGHELNKDYLDPTIIQMLKGKRIQQVSCGESHSLAVSRFGDVYSWGRGKEGQLGHPQKSMSSPPDVIKSLLHERVTKVACGNFHSLAITDQGRVYQWGQLHEVDNSKTGLESTNGLLQMHGLYSQYIAEKSISAYLNGEKDAYGDKKENSSSDEEDDSKEASSSEQSKGKHIGKIVDMNVLTPTMIDSIKNKQVIDISAGWAYSAAVTSDGQLYTWGFNEKGQLGLGDRWFHGLPQLVSILSPFHIVSVSCGRQHIGAISAQGELFTWGLGVFGQLGHGKLKSYLHPKKVNAFVEPTFIPIAQIACGANFTMVRSQAGTLYSFGHGEYGQLGCTEDAAHLDWNAKDDHFKYSVPIVVKSLADKKIINVTCGHLHTVAITDDNEVYSWGWGASGCLGFGDKKFQLVPQFVPGLSGEEVSSIGAGEKHTLVVRSADTTSFAFDYKTLINDKRYSDVAFLVQDKTIYAHRFFLKSRCPKLYSIVLLNERFTKNPTKDHDGTTLVKIPNVKYQIFMGLVHYLYTDNLIIAPHLRTELANYAKSMGMSRLASLCFRHSFKLRKTEKIPPSSFSQEIIEAIDPEFSDISFKIREVDLESIPAHKQILSTRNLYFKTMFECSFKEKDQFNFVVGDDIQKSTFKLLLEYIYGNNENIVNEENAIDLLCLADRFMIEDLKHVCEYYLEQMVYQNGLVIAEFKKDAIDDLETTRTCFDNVCLLMQVADRFSAKRLKRVCMETITGLNLEAFNILNKNETLKKIRCSTPNLIRELDYLASQSGNFKQQSLMTLIR